MTQLGEYLVHPAAEVFPMMNDVELKELAEDIKQHGLQLPIQLNYDESILVDGRNRLRACEIAGVDLTYEVLPEMTDEEILDYVVSANVRRRQLTAGQKAMVATELEPMYAEAAKERMMTGKADPRANSPEGTATAEERRSREQAAKVVGSSGKSVSDAKALKKDAPDLAEKVANGEMTLNAATKERQKRKPKVNPEQAARNAKIAELKERGKTYEEIGKTVGIKERAVSEALRANRAADEARAELEAETTDWSMLPGPQREKLEKAKASISRRLEKEFRTRLLAELDQHRARLDADWVAYKAKIDAENQMMRGLRDEERRRYQEGIEVYKARGLITPSEYMTILACLHPDNSASTEKRAEAFRLFNDSRIKTLLVKEKGGAK